MLRWFTRMWQADEKTERRTQEMTEREYLDYVNQALVLKLEHQRVRLWAMVY